MSDASKEQPFASIIGQQLTAVVFVMDYVQLQFGGLRPVLTAVNWPIVMVDGNESSVGMADYRNKLCENITKVVKKAAVTGGQMIKVEFTDGSSISISIKEPEYSGSEMAIFDNGPEDFWVWNA